MKYASGKTLRKVYCTSLEFYNSQKKRKRTIVDGERGKEVHNASSDRTETHRDHRRLHTDSLNDERHLERGDK